MLLRFDREFHDRYIHGTFRHQTFKVCEVSAGRATDSATHPQLEQQLVNSSKVSSSQDAYYQVYYREDDTNVGMRLRLATEWSLWELHL